MAARRGDDDRRDHRLRADPLNGIILGRPGDSVDIGLGIGYFVALLASAGMLVAGYLRQAVYDDRAQAARRL